MPKQFLGPPRVRLGSCVTRSNLQKAWAEVLPHPNPGPMSDHIVGPPLFIKTLHGGWTFIITINDRKNIMGYIVFLLSQKRVAAFTTTGKSYYSRHVEFQFAEYNVTHHMSLQ